eukprot:scpid19309/ scgid21324/ 
MAPPLMRMFTQHRTTSDGSRPRLDMSKDCGGEEVVTGVSQVIGETSGSREADAGDGSIAVGAFLACGSGVLALTEESPEARQQVTSTHAQSSRTTPAIAHLSLLSLFLLVSYLP